MRGRRYSAVPATWSKLKARARSMRSGESTPAERLLWRRLRNRQLAGFKFRRQHPVGPYIVDFLCAERGLAIELDGAVHDGAQVDDAKREAELRATGLRFLRFRNEEVLQDLEAVVERIRSNLLERSKP